MLVAVYHKHTAIILRVQRLVGSALWRQLGHMLGAVPTTLTNRMLSGGLVQELVIVQVLARIGHEVIEQFEIIPTTATTTILGIGLIALGHCID